MTYFWIWMVISILCLIAELATGTFTFVFFAFSAFCVAIADRLGLQDLMVQISLFSIVSILSVFLFRKKLVQAVSHRKRADLEDHSQTLIIEVDLAPQQETRVSYQGSWFTAINVDHVTLKAGNRVRIRETEGITLHLVSIRSEDQQK